MPFIKVGEENSSDIEIYFEDHGSGDPLVLIHGYPFSGTAWETVTRNLLEAGYRVITYDRRGFGKSSRPGIGYNYDTFSSDLDKLMTALNLQDVVLVGHSMGTGEVTRYVSQFGTERVRAGVLVSPIPPFLLKTEDNSTGVEAKVFTEFKDNIKKDRYQFVTEFLKNFYNLGILNHGVSDEKLRADFNLAVSSSPIAFLKCVDTWLEDFRPDLDKFTVPMLVIQGDKDHILPIDSTGKLIPDLVKDAELKVIKGGSHGIPWTHGDDISHMVLEFLKGRSLSVPLRSDVDQPTIQ